MKVFLLLESVLSLAALVFIHDFFEPLLR